MTTFSDLAKELGFHKVTLLRWAKKLNFPKKFADNDAGGNKVLVLEEEEVERLRQKASKRKLSNHHSRKDKAFDVSGNLEKFNKEDGWFYLIQLEPSHDPLRVKLGYSDNIDSRLSDHFPNSPFMILIGKWECKRRWEKTAIDSISLNLEKLSVEVFYAQSLTDIRNRCDKFFSLFSE